MIDFLAQHIPDGKSTPLRPFVAGAIIAGSTKTSTNGMINARQIFRTGLLLLSLTPLTSCALYTDTKYTEFRGDSDFYGDGGTVRTVDGIDIWETGAPNRPFRVIGRIEQTHRNDGGITSQIAGSQLDKTLIDEAIAKGADALIAIDADSRISGFNTNASASASGGFAYGSSQTTISARDRRVFAVIIYLDS